MRSDVGKGLTACVARLEGRQVAVQWEVVEETGVLRESGGASAAEGAQAAAPVGQDHVRCVGEMIAGELRAESSTKLLYRSTG